MRRLLFVMLLTLLGSPVFAAENKTLEDALTSIGVDGVLFVHVEKEEVFTYFVPTRDINAFGQKTLACEEDGAAPTDTNGKALCTEDRVRKMLLFDKAQNDDADQVHLFKVLMDSKKLMSRFDSNRVISNKGEKIRAIVDASNTTYKANVTETERDTFFIQNLKQLVSIVLSRTGPAAAGIKPLEYKDYKLAQRRANFTYTVQVGTPDAKTPNDTAEEAVNKAVVSAAADVAGKAAADAVSKAAVGADAATVAQAKNRATEAAKAAKETAVSVTPKPAEPKAVSKTITTGPSEHFYIAADFTLTKVNQIKYDSTTKTISEKETPSTFYFSLNYTLDDLFKERGCPVVLKALFRASDKPHSSLGLGIGLRFKPGTFNYNGWLDFLTNEWITPFAAVLWTKEDKLVNGNVEKESTYGKPTWVGGLSFNLDKAVEWLKPKPAKGQTEKDQAGKE